MENVIIIGGGPAGLAAAVYASRAGLKPLLFAGSPPGGQLTLTSEVENYPGYTSILGPNLIQKMRDQAVKFGTRIVDKNILNVDFSTSPFKLYSFEMIDSVSHFPPASAPKEVRAVGIPSLTATYHSPILARSIIIATGAKALWLGLESETRLRGRGVSACATCDGFFFKEKTVAVVGGGDTALEEALTLVKFAKKIYLIHRRDSFRGSKIMQERVFKEPKIEIIWNTSVEEVLGENKVEGVRLKSVKTNSTNSNQFQPISTLSVDGVFIAIGHKPDTEIFTGKVELDGKGYVITAERFMEEFAKLKCQNSNVKSMIEMSKLENLKDKFNLDYKTGTSVPGVFAAGDNVDYVYRQAATASGMGVAAALELEKWLEEVEN